MCAAEANRQKQARYRKRHPERVKASQEKFQEEHPERVSAKSKKYWDANSTQINIKVRQRRHTPEWRKHNREYMREYRKREK